MNETEILDINEVSEKMESVWESLKWWEGKRLIYNMILVGCELFFTLYHWEGAKAFGIYDALIGSAFYTFLGNIGFSMGWGSEVLITYYFKSSKGWKKMRISLFVMGVLFSICLTAMIYLNLFYYYFW